MQRQLDSAVMRARDAHYAKLEPKAKQPISAAMPEKMPVYHSVVKNKGRASRRKEYPKLPAAKFKTGYLHRPAPLNPPVAQGVLFAQGLNPNIVIGVNRPGPLRPGYAQGVYAGVAPQNLGINQVPVGVPVGGY